MIVAHSVRIGTCEETLFSLTGTAGARASQLGKRNRTRRGSSRRPPKWRNRDVKSNLVFRLVSLGPPLSAIVFFCGLDCPPVGMRNRLAIVRQTQIQRKPFAFVKGTIAFCLLYDHTLLHRRSSLARAGARTIALSENPADPLARTTSCGRDPPRKYSSRGKKKGKQLVKSLSRNKTQSWKSLTLMH